MCNMVEIVAAACVGAIALLSYAPLKMPLYASLAILGLCLVSFLYYWVLQGMPQSPNWSVALAPILIATSIPLEGSGVLAGAIAISSFLIIRSLYVHTNEKGSEP